MRKKKRGTLKASVLKVMLGFILLFIVLFGVFQYVGSKNTVLNTIQSMMIDDATPYTESMDTATYEDFAAIQARMRSTRNTGKS